MTEVRAENEEDFKAPETLLKYLAPRSCGTKLRQRSLHTIGKASMFQVQPWRTSLFRFTRELTKNLTLQKAKRKVDKAREECTVVDPEATPK
jgi:hypothetical protein